MTRFLCSDWLKAVSHWSVIQFWLSHTLYWGSIRLLTTRGVSHKRIINRGIFKILNPALPGPAHHTHPWPPTTLPVRPLSPAQSLMPCWSLTESMGLFFVSRVRSDCITCWLDTSAHTLPEKRPPAPGRSHHLPPATMARPLAYSLYAGQQAYRRIAQKLIWKGNRKV